MLPYKLIDVPVIGDSPAMVIIEVNCVFTRSVTAACSYAATHPITSRVEALSVCRREVARQVRRIADDFENGLIDPSEVTP